MEIQTPKGTEIENIAGDFGSQSAGIDKSSMPFMFEMLSKSLYSNPIGSICREITSNCFDSHIEAKVDKPVVISKGDDEEGIFICFKDVGVGLSPERIKKIYLNYFSSTKRQTNEQIGGFGLGSKTPFAYTDYFYITTIFDKIKYNYLFSKGESAPLLDLIEEEPTEEHNGTEIKIYIQDVNDEGKFQQNLKEQLSYFDNVYFIGWNINNDYIIYETDNFKYRSKDHYSDECHIVLGKVAYPIDWNKLKIKSIRIPIGIKFEIGEIQVTPNRESVRYSDETEQLIKDRINLAVEELTSMFISQNKPIESYLEYFKVSNKKPYVYFDEENQEGSKVYLTGLDVSKKHRYIGFEEVTKFYEKKDLFNELYERKFVINKDNKAVLYNSLNTYSNRIDLENLHNYKFSKSGRDSIVKNWYHGISTCVIIRRKLKLDFLETINKKEVKRELDEYSSEYNIDNDSPFFNNNYFIGSNGTYYYQSTENTNIHSIANSITGLTYNNYNDFLTTGFITYQIDRNVNEKKVDRCFGSKYYFDLGLAKKTYLAIKKIREEIEENLVKYDEIPEGTEEAYRLEKRNNDAALQRKLEGKVHCKTLSASINDYDWYIDRYITKGTNIIKPINQFKGIIVYGFREDQEKLKKAITFLAQFHSLTNKSDKDFRYNDNIYLTSDKVRVISISQSSAKYFKNKPNMCHVDNLYSDNKLFRRLSSSFKIEDYFSNLLKYQRIDAEEYISQISKICTPIGNLLNELNIYMNNVKEVDDIRYTGYHRRDIKRETIDIAKKNNLFDPLIEPLFKQLDKWFEGVELIKYIEINDENIKYILKHLREKKKKLNSDYYTRMTRPELITAQVEMDFSEPDNRTKFEVLTS